ncbi:SH3 domain and tetratricopeptide repeat-containing protein 2 isoform X2 [Rhinatrema bivittatum]|uniref:SH3 domain and tetratricopeptide repeat-containing protein 2 isoform X2 n=1 Tax=Rhinatrema bivittatum TaxID=194408 RepID=UPI0011286AD3|nr:SH3 domain and tetratricopeptide repeat-containing protein 2 isoform X2 [Rhinatrema bivittatum]
MASGHLADPGSSTESIQSTEDHLGTESVSLAVGEGYPTEILLSFSILSRSSQRPNADLQEVARKRLRAWESDQKEVLTLFKELSARLLSLQAEKDRFVITFKTVEEIWKFSTYLTLGYVACCLEELLFNEVYWLNSTLVQDTEIRIGIDEDHLTMMYLGLLLQEGTFFSRVVHCVPHLQREEEDLKVSKNELLRVKNVGHEQKWEGLSSFTGQRGLVPISAIEPLPNPFSQWFLKNYPVHCSLPKHSSRPGSCQLMGRGMCKATEDYKGQRWDELSFCRGDRIAIVGLLIPGLQWFVGKSSDSGTVGFVQTEHVALDDCAPLEKHLVFVSEEERPSLVIPREERDGAGLLRDLARTDISSVYRLDGCEPADVLARVSSEIAYEGFKGEGVCERWKEEDITNDLAEPSGPDQASAGCESSPEAEEDLLLPQAEDMDEPKFFIDLNAADLEDSEVFDPILTFLNQDHYEAQLRPLYDASFSFLSSTFYGFSDEEEVASYLETTRNWAKKSGMAWAHIRCCFLLGRLCARRMKLSQARVYFEEALNALSQGFADLPLLAALYGNLTAVYLKQKMRAKLERVMEKAATLLACLPEHSSGAENELAALMYVLRKAVVVSSAPMEARACLLLARLLLQLGRYEEVLPFTERLQCLSVAFPSLTGSAPLDVMPILSCLYDKQYLPHLALASARLSGPESVSETPAPSWRVGLVIRNTSRIFGCSLGGSHIPAQASLCLRQALCCSYQSGTVNIQKALCTILSKLHLQHGILEGAIYYADMATELSARISEEDSFQSSLFSGWMHLLGRQPERTAEMMRSLLHSMHETDGVTQCGVVHNLLAMALRRERKLQKAAESLLCSLKLATETGNRHNQAIALANFGSLALSCRASRLAESYFLKSARIYFELGGAEQEVELVHVLLRLAQIVVGRGRLEDGKVWYELALLFSLRSHNVKSQLQVTEELCHFYSKVSANSGACIIYYEHWLSLVQRLKDREKEEKLLQILSQLYQALNTAKSLRTALDYTKQSLRINIDLGKGGRVAETWLQAGRLYYLLQEDELVEMYFQAAVQTALNLQDFALALHQYEEAGDVFFDGGRKRERALAFYREGAIPLARRLGELQMELRLFQKLTELQLSLEDYEQALEFASAAARLSTLVGDRLQELVAFHRLATAYYFLRMYEMAEYCYLKALALCPPPPQCTEWTGYCLRVYYRLGSLTLLKLQDAQDAASYFLLALAAATELGDGKLQRVLRRKLAHIYNEILHDSEQAVRFV